MTTESKRITTQSKRMTTESKLHLPRGLT